MAEEADSIFGKMYRYVSLFLALNTAEQMLTWQYILVAYSQLEALALELQRLYQRKDEQTFWGASRSCHP
jgi:hypothetical protein